MSAQMTVDIYSGLQILQAVNQNLVNAGFTLTLVCPAGKTAYLTGFTIDGLGATAAGVVEITTTGLLAGTLRRELSVPAGVGLGVTPVIVELSTPMIGSAIGQNIGIVVPPFGAGNVNAVGFVHGFAI